MKIVSNILSKLLTVGLLLAILYFVMYKLNTMPNIKYLFTPKKVTIDNTNLIVTNIQSLQTLITQTASVDVVVTKIGEQENPLIPNLINPNTTKKLGLIATGTVQAGVNMQLVSIKNIVVNKDTVTLQLPEAYIISCITNPSGFDIFIETGNWTTAEINLAKQEANDKIKEKVLDMGILTQAKLQAEKVLTAFMIGLGYKVVRFGITS